MAPLAPVTSTCTTDQATAVAPRATITLAAHGALRPRHRRGGHRRPGQRARAARAPPRAARGRGRRRRRGGHRADRPQLRRHPRRHLLQARVAEGAAVRRRAPRACTRTARSAASRCDAAARSSSRCTRASCARLDELERRGRANGVPGLRRLRAEEITELEPHCAGIAGLHSPNTGIVDFGAVARAMADDVRGAGGELVLGRAVTGRRARQRRGPPGGRRGGRAPRGRSARAGRPAAWRWRPARRRTRASSPSAGST